MFPLIAIAAFFILGIAFFAFGKDDFGITRLKRIQMILPARKKKYQLQIHHQKNNLFLIYR